MYIYIYPYIYIEKRTSSSGMILASSACGRGFDPRGVSIDVAVGQLSADQVLWSVLHLDYVPAL